MQFRRQAPALCGTLAAVLCAAATGQTANPEAENNNTKSQATTASSGGAGMLSGDFISGTTTGTSTSVRGLESADYFRVKTAVASPGIYRHRLTLDSSTPFQTATIRGLSQSGTPGGGGAIGSADVAAQLNNTAASLGGRFVQWYGFGKGEEIYYRVTGTPLSTSPYTATLTSVEESPVVLATSVIAGQVSVTTAGQGHSTDTDFWLYGANLDAVPGFGRDDNPGGGVQGTVSGDLVPGTYTLAVSTSPFANDQPGPVGEASFGTVLDFPGACVAGSDSNASTPLSVSIAGIPVTLSRNGPFEVKFVRFNVPLPPTLAATGTAAPSAVSNSGTATVVFTATVTPGTNPPSTGVRVEANLSLIGGGAATPLLDNGLPPDAVAGDNVYSALFTVPAQRPPGVFSLPYEVTDAQGRSYDGTFAGFRIAALPPTVENLGDFSPPRSLSRFFDLQMSQTRWYRIELSAPVSAGGQSFLDIDTEGSLPGRDTEMALYSLDGALRAQDDGSGSDLLSQLTFGLGGRPPGGSGGLPYDGRHGDLPAGVYFLAVNRFNSAYFAGFLVAPSGSSADGLRLNLRSTPTATPPFANRIQLPEHVGNDGTASFILVCDVTPGSTPPSTGLAVVADAGSVGAGVFNLRDDGLPPDVSAGDLRFTGSAMVATGTPAGPRSIQLTVSDAQGRGTSSSRVLFVFQSIGACCIATGCVFTTPLECAALSGTYLGGTVPCSAGDQYTVTPGVGAFEDVQPTGTLLLQSGDDVTVPVTLAFPFRFYGQTFTGCSVSTNGNLQFNGSNSTSFVNRPIPSLDPPNNAIYAHWTDLVFQGGGGLHTEVRGTSGANLRQIVQWSNARLFGASASDPSRTFQVVLFEDGRIELRYLEVTAGASPTQFTFGVENPNGTVATTIDPALVTSGASLALAYQPGLSNCGPAQACARDYNGIEGINGDDLADFIVDFFDSITDRSTPLSGGALPIPGGFPGTATAAFPGFGRPCPLAQDVPQPNPWGAPTDAYRTNGFKVGLGQNNTPCTTPNGDDLADYIGIFFNGCP